MKVEQQINRQLERLILAAMEIQAAANHLLDLRRQITEKEVIPHEPEAKP